MVEITFPPSPSVPFYSAFPPVLLVLLKRTAHHVLLRSLYFTTFASPDYTHQAPGRRAPLSDITALSRSSPFPLPFSYGRALGSLRASADIRNTRRNNPPFRFSLPHFAPNPRRNSLYDPSPSSYATRIRAHSLSTVVIRHGESSRARARARESPRSVSFDSVRSQSTATLSTIRTKRPPLFGNERSSSLPRD